MVFATHLDKFLLLLASIEPTLEVLTFEEEITTTTSLEEEKSTDSTQNHC
jgi:hypothetical protein